MGEDVRVGEGTIRTPWDERERPMAGDVVVAGLATSVALVVLFLSNETGVRDPDVLSVGLLVLAGILLLARRLWPATVLGAVVVTTTTVLALGFAGGVELPLVAVALYTAMAQGRRVPAIVVLTLTISAGVGYRLFVEGDDPLLVAVTVAPLILVALLGEATRTRRQLRREARERLRIVEAEKELEARAQITAERLRIARELHDVLAHTITTITVQAGAAADGLAADDPARTPLLVMRRTAREAMQQLQATIQVLRSEHDSRTMAAAPRLAGLPDLVRGVHEMGIDVEVTTDGPERALPAAVELTAYRIVQEALTNVIRHADAGRAEVSLSFEPDVLRVSVVDDGAAIERGRLDPDGFGLVGMRERAQALGGSLDAGPAPAGGFGVHAVLPVGRADP